MIRNMDDAIVDFKIRRYTSRVIFLNDYETISAQFER